MFLIIFVTFNVHGLTQYDTIEITRGTDIRSDKVIKFKLGELLEEKGKSMYWLHKETGVRANSVSDWVNGEVKKIPVDVLDKFCIVLDCGIEDLIEFQK